MTGRVDPMFIRSRVLIELARNGEVIHREAGENLVTQVGDQFYGERAVGLGALANVTGMRIGKGATAAAKTGAGAAIVTFIAGSQKALEAGFPASALNGSARRISYQCIWGAGVVTDTALREFVLTNESPLSNVAGTAANTVARYVAAAAFDKGALDTLTVTWAHDLQGT